MAAPGKARNLLSAPSLCSFHNLAFHETVPTFAVRLTMALSRPFKEDRQALPFSFFASLLQVIYRVMSLASCLQCRQCFKLLNTSDQSPVETRATCDVSVCIRACVRARERTFVCD